MNFITPVFSSNELLSTLPPAELGQLRPLLTRVQLVNGQTLHEAGERIEQVFFVEQGFVSMVADADGSSLGTEVGLIGREGMVGLPVLLDPQAVSFNRAMVQMPGVAHRLPAQALRDSAGALPVLWRLLLQALEVSMAQVAQTAACNSQHSLSQRLARWLLMAHDRVDGDNLPLTQEFVAKMLAVRRAGVAGALASLQTAGVISQRRGRILVCDRAGLEAAACGCYGRVQAFAATVAARNPDPEDLAA
jgi:CRP-like cAMP-binding protein